MQQGIPASDLGNAAGTQGATLADVVAHALAEASSGPGTASVAAGATVEGSAYRAWIGCLIFSVGVTGSAIGLNLQKYAIRNQRRSRKQSSSSNNASTCAAEGARTNPASPEIAIESNYSATPSKLGHDGSALGGPSTQDLFRFELSWLKALAPTEAEVGELNFAPVGCRFVDLLVKIEILGNPLLWYLAVILWLVTSALLPTSLSYASQTQLAREFCCLWRLSLL